MENKEEKIEVPRSVKERHRKREAEWWQAERKLEQWKKDIAYFKSKMKKK